MSTLNGRLDDAIQQFDVDKVKAALEEGADANAKLPVIETRVRNKASTEYKLSEPSNTPLSRAILFEHFDQDPKRQKIIELLLQRGAKIVEDTGTDMSYMKYAVMTENPNAIELLVRYGGKVEGRHGKNNTPLHFASEENFDVAAAKLIELGADVNSTSPYQMTCLHKAFEGHFTEVAKILIENGANLNIKGPNNKTCRDMLNSHTGFRDPDGSQFYMEMRSFLDEREEAAAAEAKRVRKDKEESLSELMSAWDEAGKKDEDVSAVASTNSKLKVGTDGDGEDPDTGIESSEKAKEKGGKRRRRTKNNKSKRFKKGSTRRRRRMNKK